MWRALLFVWILTSALALDTLAAVVRPSITSVILDGENILVRVSVPEG